MSVLGRGHLYNIETAVHVMHEAQVNPAVKKQLKHRRKGGFLIESISSSTSVLPIEYIIHFINQEKLSHYETHVIRMELFRPICKTMIDNSNI